MLRESGAFGNHQPGEDTGGATSRFRWVLGRPVKPGDDTNGNRGLEP
jgi:hypothetical protein